MLEKQFKITSETGLHARVSSQLVREASSFTSKISLSVGDTTVDFKSIMGVMSLGVPTKATVEIVAEGEDEKEVIAKIAEVIKKEKVAE